MPCMVACGPSTLQAALGFRRIDFVIQSGTRKDCCGADGARSEGRAMPADPGPEERLSERLRRGAPLAAIVLVVSAVALFLIYALLGVLKLVAIALLLALALRTVVRGLEGAKFPTWLSVIVLLLGIGAFGAVVWLVMVP